MESKQKLEKLEIVKSEPYRFIGGCLYIGNKGQYIDKIIRHEFIWQQSDYVFQILDGLKEYASDETHNAHIATWDKYDDKNQLFGYYIGRFMKPNTPVPPDLDYFDVTAEYIGKAWWKGKRGEGFGRFWGGGIGAIFDECRRTGLYTSCAYEWEAQVFSEPDENGETFVGAYCPCAPINPPQ